MNILSDMLYLVQFFLFVFFNLLLVTLLLLCITIVFYHLFICAFHMHLVLCESNLLDVILHWHCYCMLKHFGGLQVCSLWACWLHTYLTLSFCNGKHLPEYFYYKVCCSSTLAFVLKRTV